ncbi:MAG: IS256 family transposase [Acidimicrobiales bacterium]
MLRVHVDEVAGAELSSSLDAIVAEGARRMLAAALEAEVDAYVSSFTGEVDEHGRRLVVRNGYAEARSLVTGAGPLEVRAPRVNDCRVDEVTGERIRFRSSILPPWARKSPKVAEVLPLMYLHGMSSGDFAPALEEFFGSAAGLSASVITRLTNDWQKERDQFSHRSLKDVDYVYLWADGIHFNVRLEEARLCALVIVGVRADGTKELVSISDGHRESTESWADVLRGLKRRGMTAPVLAVGDGALGFWGALGEVFPDTVHQRCWVHKMANVMNALPKSAQPAARAALAEVRDAEDREHAEQAIEQFAQDYEAKWPKAVEKVRKDQDALLAFFDFPAEHWIHLKTTNPIESTFATVRLRTKVTKGPGSRAAGLAMAYKLIESAQTRWRAVNAPQLVALVRAGVKFEKGVMVERSEEHETEVAA